MQMHLQVIQWTNLLNQKILSLQKNQLTLSIKGFHLISHEMKKSIRNSYGHSYSLHPLTTKSKWYPHFFFITFLLLENLMLRSGVVGKVIACSTGISSHMGEGPCPRCSTANTASSLRKVQLLGPPSPLWETQKMIQAPSFPSDQLWLL